MRYRRPFLIILTTTTATTGALQYSADCLHNNDLSHDLTGGDWQEHRLAGIGNG
jgi:hypothetical protein